MGYKIYELFDNIDTETAAEALYALLNRIPIFLSSNETEEVYDILIDLIKVVDSIREPVVFNKDIASAPEILTIMKNERSDPNYTRKLFEVDPHSFRYAIEAIEEAINILVEQGMTPQEARIQTFKSWIFSCNPNDLQVISFDFPALIITKETSLFKVDKMNFSPADIQFERRLLEFSEEKANKMENLMKSSIKEALPPELRSILGEYFTFDSEKEKIRKNALNSEIENLSFKALNVYNILSKLEAVDERWGIEATISAAAIEFSIDPEEAIKMSMRKLRKTKVAPYVEALLSSQSEKIPLKRILDFITNEFFTDLTKYVNFSGSKFSEERAMKGMWYADVDTDGGIALMNQRNFIVSPYKKCPPGFELDEDFRCKKEKY